ncbi:MAG: hypothetical protein HC769_05870 [Cyanobacteria bacterium CRU_2_1]|nr:hypothetical protein [Cyanobacteria bacterium RU_5_0]NJR58417.1 hypothetical protein [Cyanobacteria bacterium CRU_2_1]
MTYPSPEARRSPNIFKWVAIGCGTVLVLLIGLGIGLFFWARQALNLSFDSKQAELTAQSIMDYQIPGGSQGVVSTKFGGIELAGITSTSNPEGVFLFLGRVTGEAQGNSAEIQESMQDSLERQMGENITVTSERTESRQLCGQTVDVTITEGQQTRDGQSDSQELAEPALTYQTSLTHNGNLLFVSLTTIGADAQPIAEQIFDSLNCK